MHLIFASLKCLKLFKKAQAHQFFANLQTLKKHEFYFLQVTKVQKNVNVVFVSFKNLKKYELDFIFQA